MEALSEFEKIEYATKLEHRRRKRYQLIFNIAVVDLKTEQEIGWLINISSQGFMLSSQRNITDELLSHLTFRFPEDIDMDENVVFEAHTCWTKPDANPKYHLTGFKITDDLEKYSKIADILIKKYSTEDHLNH